MSRRLEDVYRDVPRIECRGLCSEYCGPIAMTTLERQRMEAAHGHQLPQADKGLNCSMLDFAGRCSIYEARPLICRLWGVADGMRCPHGCHAERILTDAEAGDLLQAARDVGGPAEWMGVR